MKNEDFEIVITEQMAYCMELLLRKGEEYDSATEDRLHSFKTAAALQGITPKQALAGMLCKHTVSIYDMCRSGNYSFERWQEKITDHINYLLLLEAMIKEELNEKD